LPEEELAPTSHYKSIEYLYGMSFGPTVKKPFTRFCKKYYQIVMCRSLKITGHNKALRFKDF
jgi:hypothetical protein|tara:strand:- start:249 stop:434 length:186 start_codon:yes stop_codon:yes gene_type:complete